jgi:hypothetical protein
MKAHSILLVEMAISIHNMSSPRITGFKNHLLLVTFHAISADELKTCRRSKYLELTSDHVEVGHVVVILNGGQSQFMLRGVDKCYTLVGKAYIHGIKDGAPVVGDSICQDLEIW